MFFFIFQQFSFVYPLLLSAGGWRYGSNRGVPIGGGQGKLWGAHGQDTHSEAFIFYRKIDGYVFEYHIFNYFLLMVLVGSMHFFFSSLGSGHKKDHLVGGHRIGAVCVRALWSDTKSWFHVIRQAHKKKINYEYFQTTSNILYYCWKKWLLTTHGRGGIPFVPKRTCFRVVVLFFFFFFGYYR